MNAPKRMTVPRRMNAARPPTMFPHTVTVYNVEEYRGSVTEIHITFLRGVLLDASKGVNVRESGLEGADAVILYIPFDVEAVDGITNKKKSFIPPIEFYRSEDQSGIWTLGPGHTFFVKGEALPPEGTALDDVTEKVELLYDHVYNVTKVDEKDYGGLQHFEVGGA